MRTSRRQLISSIVGGFIILSVPASAQSGKNTSSELIEGIIADSGERISELQEDNNRVLEEFAAELSEVEYFDLDHLEDANQVTSRQTFRLKHITRVLNQNLDLGIPSSYLQPVESKTRAVRKYVPLVASAQNLIEDAETYNQTVEESRDPEAIKEAREELLISALLFSCEICLFQTAATYKLSFNATGYVANAGLVRIREVVGHKVYAMILSEVHWVIRGSLADVQTYIIEKSGSIAAEMGSEIDYSTRWELERLSERDLEYAFIEKKATKVIERGKEETKGILERFGIDVDPSDWFE